MSSSEFIHHVPGGPLYRVRDNVILNLCRGRRVIHVGCTDWPYTESGLSSGTLLHAKLINVTESVVGVDVDAAGIKLLETALPGEYVVQDLTTEVLAQSVLIGAEVILAADVLEHVSDEAAFLAGLARLAERAGASCSVVVTTPNGLGLRNSIFTLFRREIIHPDHRRVHTPRTLRAVLEQAGLQLSSVYYYSFNNSATVPRKLLNGVVAVASHISRGYADGLIFVSVTSAKKNSTPAPNDV